MDKLMPSATNSSPLTTLVFLERAATIYGDCKSVIYNDQTFTWSQTHRRCLQLASALVSTGIKRGEVVSVFAPNIPAMYELHFAVPMAGAVLNTINIRLDARTISVILSHSEAKLVFIDCASRALVLEALSLLPPNSPRPRLVLITDDTVEPSLSSSSWTADFIDTYESLLMKGDPAFEWVRPSTDWDPMILNYTSGTTSSPKGVVHCHKGIYEVTLNSLIEWFVPKQPVYLWTLPMFHANGWSFPWGMAAVGGINICLRKFDGKTVFNLIDRHGVTNMCCAPVVLNMLSNYADNNRLKNPVEILTSGAPPPATILFRAEALGFRVSHAYGLTETAGIVIACTWNPRWDELPASERARLKARQGVKNICMQEVAVVDAESGLSVKRDGSTPGEIVLRGASVMLGYLKDPEGTAKVMKNGWFYTGDVGVMHPDGYLEIKDRSKDVIISGGENISSVEVETVMFTHPAINEVAVVARADEFWGETVCAFVSLKERLETKPTETELIEYGREKLPRYMVPKTLVFMDDLPKTSTGKVQKFLLRDIAKAMGTMQSSRSTKAAAQGVNIPLPQLSPPSSAATSQLLISPIMNGNFTPMVNGVIHKRVFFSNT